MGLENDFNVLYEYSNGTVSSIYDKGFLDSEEDNEIKLISCKKKDSFYKYNGDEYARVLNWILFALYNGYIISTLIYMYYYRSKSIFLSKRSDMYLVSLTSFACCVLTLFLVREAIGRDSFPCSVYIAFCTIIIPLICAPVVARLILFYNKSIYTKNLQKMSIEAMETAHFEKRIKRNFIAHTKKNRRTSFLTPTTLFSGKAIQKMKKAFANFVFYLTQKPQSNINNGGGGGNEVVDIKRLMLMDSSTKTILGIKIVLLILFPYVLTIIIRLTTTDYLFNNCVGCYLMWNDLILLIFNLLFIIILCAWALRKVKGAADPMGVILEIRMALWVGIIFALLGMLLASIDVKDYDAKGVFTYSYFYLLAAFLIHNIQVVLPVIRIKQHRKIINMQTKGSTGSATSNTTALSVANGQDTDTSNRPSNFVFGIWSAPKSYDHADDNESQPRGSNLSALKPSDSVEILDVKNSDKMNPSQPSNSKYTRESNMSNGSLPTFAITMVPEPKEVAEKSTDGGTDSEKEKDSDSGSSDPSASQKLNSKRFSMFYLGANTSNPNRPRSTKEGRDLHAKHRFGGFGPNGEIVDSALSVLLHDPTGKILFDEYITSEFSPEGPRFLYAVEKWVYEYDTLTVAQRYKQALRIYSLFVYEGSLLQVNLSDESRIHLDNVFLEKGYGDDLAFILEKKERKGSKENKSTHMKKNSSLQESDSEMEIPQGISIQDVGEEREVKSIKEGETSSHISDDEGSVSGRRGDGKREGQAAKYLPRSLFDEAQNEIFLLMCNDNYPRFLQSNIYKKWVIDEPENAKRFPQGFGNQMIRAPPPAIYNGLFKNNQIGIGGQPNRGSLFSGFGINITSSNEIIESTDKSSSTSRE